MSERISRGEIISLITGLPAAIAATTAIAAAADDSGGTKAQYKYQVTPGPGGKQCGQCALFVSPKSCKIVKGAISPKGYCIAFSPKPK